MITVDTIAPPTPPAADLIAASDTGSSSVDNITADSTPALSDTAEPFATVKVYDGVTLLGSVTADAAGLWTFTTGVFADGIHSLAVTASDSSGNTSAASTPLLVIEVDTIAPVTPPTVDLNAASDTGTSPTDNITADSTPTLSGTVEPFSTIKVYDGATLLGSVTVDAGGTWTFTTAVLPDGVHSLTVTATDTSGNVSASSTALLITIDTTAPSTPPLADLIAASDTGSSSTDNVTADNTPTLSGTAEANAIVSVYDGVTLLGTTLADGTGVWSFTTAVRTDGVHSFTVTATESSGNTSAVSAPLAVTIDTTSPVAPSPADLLAASDTGTSSTDNITADNTPTLSGTGEPFATVRIYNGATLVGTAIVDAAGNWTVTTSALADGVVSLTASVIDPSGNVSAASAALLVTIDTTPP